MGTCWVSILLKGCVYVGEGKGAVQSVCVCVCVNSDSHLHTTRVKQQVKRCVCDFTSRLVLRSSAWVSAAHDAYQTLSKKTQSRNVWDFSYSSTLTWEGRYMCTLARFESPPTHRGSSTLPLLKNYSKLWGEVCLWRRLLNVG